MHDTVSSSRSLASLSSDAERLFWRILAQTDSWGRMRGEPIKVRVTCVPMLDWDDDLVAALLDELQDAGRVAVYDDGADVFLQVVDFDRNQPESSRRRGTSKFPEFTGVVRSSPVMPRSSPVLSRGRVEESEEREEQDQKPAATKDSRAASVVWTLADVRKPGYRPDKLTVERVEAVVAKHPTLDVEAEAEKLRDWEIYGGGEKRATKDGVAALRNWLTRAAAPSTNGHSDAAEVDYPWLPGCEPK